MSGPEVLYVASLFAIGLMLLALFLTVIRLIRGPNLGDRILALDLITVLAAGLIGVLVLMTGFSLYIDIAIALALVSFLSTVALARYLFVRASRRDADLGGKS